MSFSGAQMIEMCEAMVDGLIGTGYWGTIQPDISEHPSSIRIWMVENGRKIGSFQLLDNGELDFSGIKVAAARLRKTIEQVFENHAAIEFYRGTLSIKEV